MYGDGSGVQESSAWDGDSMKHEDEASGPRPR